MWPPKRPSARMGSSRFTRAPRLIREKEVRFQVSAARSAAKDLGVISTAVRQTPLTAMLSPFLSSLVRREAETVRRRLPFLSEMRATRPTSSMMPVNMRNLRFMINRSTNSRCVSPTCSHGVPPAVGWGILPTYRHSNVDVGQSRGMGGGTPAPNAHTLYCPYGYRKYPSTAKSSPKRCKLTDFT